METLQKNVSGERDAKRNPEQCELPIIMMMIIMFAAMETM
jgi:hypothetical protein